MPSWRSSRPGGVRRRTIAERSELEVFAMFAGRPRWRVPAGEAAPWRRVRELDSLRNRFGVN